MAELTLPPTWIDAGDSNAPQYTGASLRSAIGSLLMQGTASTASRTGALHANDFKVSLSGTTVMVAAGGYAIGTTAGAYLCPLNTTLNLGALAPADAVNARVDLVVLRVDDPSNGGTIARTGSVVTLTGTASSSPVPPSVAGTSVYAILARIDVPRSGGGSPVVTDQRTYTVAAGGIAPFATQSEILNWGAPAGTVAFCLADGNLYARQANGWKTLRLSTDTQWVNLGNPPTGWTLKQSVMYRIIDGIVYLRGALQNTTHSGGWITLFTLPLEARPGYTVSSPVQGNSTTGMAVQILNTGEVQVWYEAATSAWLFMTAVPPFPGA